MRCRACDKDNAVLYGEVHPDWYCAECAHMINRTLGKVFNEKDLIELLDLNELEVKETYSMSGD
jgi:hypothetical protein